MKLNKFTLSFIASIALASASAHAITSDEEAVILADFESSVSAVSSEEALLAQLSQLVSQYPSLAESIVAMAVASSPDSTAQIVTAAIESVKASPDSSVDISGAVANIVAGATRVNPTAAETITEVAVSQEPSAALNIVQAVAQQVQVAVNNGQITGEQAGSIISTVETTAQQTASANGVTVTSDDVTIASNTGTIDALNNANPTAAGEEDAPTTEAENVQSVNAINRANRDSEVSPS